jgi:ATP-dependent protease Clp ATPase subunit
MRARALRTIIEEVMMDSVYEIPSTTGVDTTIIPS